jgi:hypothetical protein
MIRSQSRHSRRTYPTQRSAWPFAWGVRKGVRTVPIPSLASTASKAVENLQSRSRSRIVGCTPATSRRQHRFLACWVTL